MSYTYSRTLPGQLYGLLNNTVVLRHPLNLKESQKMRQLHDGDLVFVIATDLEEETLGWSLCLYIDGTLEHPAARYGWIHNNNLTGLP